jgi:hypothetical protein
VDGEQEDCSSGYKSLTQQKRPRHSANYCQNDRLRNDTLLCKKILTFCFCSQLQQAQRYAKLLAPSKKVSYQTTIVDLFLPMSQVGNSKWIPTCHPSKNPSVSDRHAKAGTKAMDKVWFEKRQRCCTRPGGLASFRDHPDEFLRNIFFSGFLCWGTGWWGGYPSP